MVSHTSSAVALALRASTPVQSGKTRICISGFAKYSHNTGHSKKLANAIVKAYPQDHETWYHMASTELEVSTERSPTPQRTHRTTQYSLDAAIPCTTAPTNSFAKSLHCARSLHATPYTICICCVL